MINFPIAYKVAEVEKKKVLSEAEDLYKSKLLSQDQWHMIKKEYASKLYTPTIFMRVLLFIFSLIGMMTIMGPIVQIFSNIGEPGYRFLSIILGILILFVTDKLLIIDRYHYKSGITEAGIYSAMSFLAFAILGSDPANLMICAIVGFLLAAFAAARYLNLLALVAAIGFLGWILYQIITGMGGMVEALMPFLFMAASGILFWGGKKLQARLKNVIFDDQFVIVKTIALLFFYIAGNYFVVREMSISLMGLQLSPGEDIPFAILFYLLTALVPMGYIYWGIRQKSIIWIRIGLLTGALSIVTFKYYFSLSYPMLTVTISGAVLIVIALVFFNYLKQIRNGFTRELLLHDKWASSDLTVLLASQTLGGNKSNVSTDDGVVFKGGSFGGAGAGENW
ncbi:MAG TPA: hypothetical protein VGK10_13780 [Prolixibacteraceae bacterium]|jgi:hypothetical protein